MTTATETLVQPVSNVESMNKSDIYAHIQAYHGPLTSRYRGEGLTSKSSKDLMIAAHEADHAKWDFEHVRATWPNGAVKTSFQQRWGSGDNEGKIVTYIFHHDDRGATIGEPEVWDGFTQIDGVIEQYLHEHVVPEINDTQREVIEGIKAGVITTVLNVSERKALKELVDNDFATLRTQIRQFSDEVRESRLADVRAEWAEKVKLAEKEETAARKAVEESNKKLQKLMDDAKVKGIELKIPLLYVDGVHNSKVSVSVTGLKEAEQAVVAEVRRDLDAALHTLERQRLSAQRTVLMTGVGTDGRKILDTIPTAQALMVEAAAERSNKQINS